MRRNGTVITTPSSIPSKRESAHLLPLVTSRHRHRAVAPSPGGPVLLENLAPFLGELASESGAVVLDYFARPGLAVEAKADATPVTAADRAAEAVLRRLIESRFPEHGILGEEFGEDRPDAEFVWVLDPIDGTRTFVAGSPLFGTLIALLHQGQPIVGAVHLPALSQLFLGDGRTATCNGRPVRVRSGVPLEQATVLVTDVLAPERLHPGGGFDALTRRCAMVRTWGDCFGYTLLASGGAQAMMDPIMNPWDIAALIPVVSGAGGTITDWHGRAPWPAESTVAAAPDLHPQVILILNGS